MTTADKHKVRIGGHTLSVTNLEKQMYPLAQFTKADVIDYYCRIAPYLLPHIRNRPVTMKRYPHGVEGESFYEKRCPKYRPDWVHTAPVWSNRKQEVIDYCVINDIATLVWAANLADLEMHTSLSHSRLIDRPTMVVFDLDPGEPATIEECCTVALQLRAYLANDGLDSYVKTSGSKGIHMAVPLNSEVSYDETKAYARNAAAALRRSVPDLVVDKMLKKLRAGKVFIDWSQNDDSKTTVSVYSLRATPLPQVSTPVTWDEIEEVANGGDPDMLVFSPSDVLHRVDELGDLFEPVAKSKQRLP